MVISIDTIREVESETVSSQIRMYEFVQANGYLAGLTEGFDSVRSGWVWNLELRVVRSVGVL